MAQFRYRHKSTGEPILGIIDASVDRIAGPLTIPEIDVVQGTEGNFVMDLPIPGLFADLIEGGPARAVNNAGFGLLNNQVTSGATSFVVQCPAGLSLSMGKPIFLGATWEDLDDLRSDSTKREIVWPTGVSALGNDQYSVNCAALTNAYSKSAVAVQLEWGKVRLSSLGVGRDGYRQVGLRAQEESPDPPTYTLTPHVSLHQFTAAITPPESNNFLANCADIFVFQSKEEAERGVPFTRVADRADVDITGTAPITSSPVTTYGGGPSGGGGVLAAGDYWVVIISKNTTGALAARRSGSGVLTKVTVV